MVHTPIPDIPGFECEDPQIKRYLSQRVAELCHLPNTRFPGSQPVSFSSASLKLLEEKNFWVCEKSDGVRVLIFVIMNTMTGKQEVWLIDRKQRYFNVEGLQFPHWENIDLPLTDTLIDGELVIDVDRKTGEHVLRYYAFDCLVLNGETVMSKTLEKRFARLRDWIVQPYKKALIRIPEWKDSAPFDILTKDQELSYHINQVLKVHIPKLEHGHDGLIFTCAESEYVPGTDEKILKWKSPLENSIDFKLELRFPAILGNSQIVDVTAKPIFLLYTWLGGEAYEYFDDMEMEDSQWEEWKSSGIQYDGQIIEVCWDLERNTWSFMRIRDDKPHANHKTTMDKVIESIQDGVEVEAIISRSEAIRTAWKARQAAREGRAPPQPAAQPHQNGARRPTVQPPTPGGSGSGPGSAYPVTPGGVVPPVGMMSGLKR